ncbi:MAG TPA: tRNA (adenosine(37)-N6)-dimethylallyltransferase MiaA [Candidatus Saccharimonadaceae bacterium]|nr:tRNA (adenosine(37)-N6)-dimethylallyltransferase MiaA [Candidatus Saccharimonadaceae bacterium]
MAAGFMKPPILVIVGPTASGKTAFAIDLAVKHEGEIIGADSRTVYRGMDIGTAKPTPVEQAKVPHWGLDLVDPGEPFSVADFKRYATAKIDEIRLRGHTPILVGGSGLYIDAIVFDLRFGGIADKNLRRKLEDLTLDELYEYCHKYNILLPENQKNKRYIIRTIERNDTTIKRKHKPISGCIIVGIATERSVLRNRIMKRSEQILDDGVVEEARILGKKYSWESEAMTGNIYPLVRQYIEGNLSLKEVNRQLVTLDRKLAKRQMTWLRRNPYIEWCTRDEAVRYIESKLASEY